MPRIKRWFPVNHNINRDPEVWVMRKTIGEKSLSIWMEFLSIADQNEGEIPGGYEPLIRSVSGTCQATVRTVSAVYQYAISQVWLRSYPTLHVVKYWNYHKQREPINPLLGSLPSDPSYPNHPKKNKSQPSAVFELPDWVPTSAWDEFTDHRLKRRAKLTDKISARLVGVLDELRGLGYEPGAVLHKAIDRNWIAFEVDWITKSGGRHVGDESKPTEPKAWATIRQMVRKN